MKRFFLILLSTVLTAVNALPNDESKADEGSEKDGKVFSLFSIVQFRNDPCRSNMVLTGTTSTGFRNGTCLTASECGNKNGASSGSCAGGFGVCCVFMISTCGGAISQNCSYIKNPNAPAPYTDTTACSYTLNKCASDVCDFRLDFEMFTTSGPTITTEVDGGVCADTLTTTVTTGQTIPVICGQNNGQHIYLDVGRMPTDTAMLNFAFAGAFNRLYDIKVTQIPCNSPASPPDNCLQYHTGLSGEFQTFNFEGNDQHLASQTQLVCIRQEEGFCCIDYQLCNEMNSMTLDNANAADFAKGNIGSNCSKDYIIIEASSATGTGSLQSRYCGGKLTDQKEGTISTNIRDCTAPFEVTFITDDMVEAAVSTVTNRGTCLKYNQVPC